ncbi:MAG: hypothetical protein H0X66_16240 [Verrucomicrobia bacterium]|nr:hypothetical protein [Verrucomicrobiota bacterium]
MATQTIRTGVDLPAAFKRISWSAVFAGVVVTIMVGLLLNLLGIGIGLHTIEPTTEAAPMAGLGIGAGIWWVVSSLIALFAGGYVAGRLAGVTRTYDATLHGVLTWGVVTLITFYLLTTTFGALIGGTANMLGRGLAGGGQQQQQPGQQITAQHGGLGSAAAMAQIRAEANFLIMGDDQKTQATENKQKVAQDLNQALTRMFSQGAVNESERPKVVSLIVAGTGEQQQAAEQLVDRWASMYQEGRVQFEAAGTGLEQRVAEVGERAVKGVGTASLWLFFGLLLGGIAAALGGRTGIPGDLVVKEKQVNP